MDFLLSEGNFLLLIAAAIGLGALHALEPGHGKSLLGAYLIGTRGTVRDALLMGFAAAVTHTGSVILLGVLATIAAAWIVPERVTEGLEVVSALLALGMGLFMVFRFVRHRYSHHHRHDHNHHPAPGAEGTRRDFWGLVLIGVSGGMVPCPGALAVLLAAFATGKVTAALILVVAFSIGTGAVLIAIAVTMVKAGSLLHDRVAADSRLKAYAPLASGVVVTALGTWLSVKALFGKP